MRITDSEESKLMDEYTIKNIGIPSEILMENAAIGILENIEEAHKSFVIVCGTGNNGGDALAAARHIYGKNKSIAIYLVGNEDKLIREAALNYNIVKNLGIEIKNIKAEDDMENLKAEIKSCDAVIDGIFGIGLKRNVEGIYKDVITVINDYSNFTYSIDVPSGLTADRGEVLGTAVKADITITLNLYKTGFLSYSAMDYTGKIVVCDIGIPEEVKNRFHKGRFITDRACIRSIWKKRSLVSNKGEFGRALVFAGSTGFTGAAKLTSKSAIKAGAGLVTLITKDQVFESLQESAAENMTIPFSEKSRIVNLIEGADGIGFGPGLSKDEETLSMLELVCQCAKCPVVIDADGLNVLKDNKEILKNGEYVLTPHPKEMERLSGINIEDINKNRISIAENYAKENNVILLLKGYNTVITNGAETYINPTGSSAMASGGMGDALTGIITSFIAQGYKPFKAAVLGAYIHGYIGDKLSEKMFSVNASDLINEIPYILKEF
ncbi:MAG: NAD(P)H-hydrate dehydratase [Bacillota bacterium]|nr:NAD(P)H-hydrate dehydratase [Bacillota bacterium]